MGIKSLFGASSTILLFFALSLGAQPSLEDSHIPVERFGAVGDGVADDSVALQAGLTFVQGTKKSLVLTGTYRVVTPVTATAGISVFGGGTIQCENATASTVCITPSGTGLTGAATTPNQTVAEADRSSSSVITITMTAAQGTWAVGDWLRISYVNGSIAFTQTAKIQGISGNNITFHSPITIPFDVATTTVQETSLADGVRFRDITFTGAETAAKGFVGNNLVNAKFSNVVFDGFVEQGFKLNAGVDNKSSGIILINSGSASFRGLELTDETRVVLSDVSSRDTTTSFGLMCLRCTQPTFFNVRVDGANSQGILLQGNVRAKGSNLSSNNVVGSGLTFSKGTYRSEFSRVEVFNNSVQGFQFDNSDNQFNIITSAHEVSSGTRSVIFGATDVNNSIQGTYESTVLDNGARNTIGVFGAVSTPQVPPINLELFESNSDRTAGTVNGFRKSTFNLYCNDTDDIDNTCMMITNIQRTNPGAGTIKRTGLTIHNYTELDNGGDNLGLLAVSTGFGAAIGAFKNYTLRPVGWADGSGSPAPAMVAMTNDEGAGFLAVAGYSTTPKNGQALHIRVDSAASKGLLITTADAVFDNRKAIEIGSFASGVPNTALKFDVEYDGDTTWTHTDSVNRIINGSTKATQTSSNSTSYVYTFSKNRGGVSANVNDNVGVLGFNFMNSTPAEIQAGLILGKILDETATTEDLSFEFRTMVDGTLANRLSIQDSLRLIDSGTRPTCDATHSGMVWYEDTATDTAEICLDTGGGLAWADLLGSGAPDIDSVTGQANWGSAATKETADLIINGVEVDFEAGGAEGFPRLAQSTTPPASECDAAAEAGRLYFDSDADTDGTVLVCTGTGGWKDIDDDGGAGGYTSWDLDGDNTSPQTITDGNTALIAGTAPISTVASATDTLTVSLDAGGVNSTHLGTDSVSADELNATGVQSELEAVLNHDSLVNFVSGEHILHSGVDMIAGRGLTGGGTIDASRTFHTLSTEVQFLEDGNATSLTCGGANFGKVQVMNDGTFEICDGAATSVLRIFTPGVHTTDASLLVAGVLADARVQASNVTQHEAALSIVGSQVDSGTVPAARVGTDHIDAASEVAADVIGTSEFDDGADTPLSGEYLRVDTVDQAGIEYRTTSEVLADIGGAAASHVHAGGDITTGTVDEARLDANVVLDNAANTWTTGAQDMGGVGSFEIPNGATPTVNAAGEIAEDTTDEQLIMGANGRVIGQPYKWACTAVNNLAAADDDTIFMSPGSNITLVDAWCHCQGTCSTEADLSFEYREVGTASTVTDVTGTVTCEDYVTGDSKTTLSGNVAVPTLDVIRFDVDNAVSPETDEYSVCLGYRIDPT